MQVEVAKAYKNGSTEAQARYEAEKAIEGYYSVKQRNLIAQWNTHAATIKRLKNVSEMEANMSGDFISASHSNDQYDTQYTSLNEMRTVNVTLANGTAVETTEIVASTSSNTFTVTPAYHNGGAAYTLDWFIVQAPTSSYDKAVAWNRTRYSEPWNKIETQNSALISEAKTFVNATYADFDSGEANASDVIDANTAMFEYGTRSGSENESLYNSVGALAMMGFDTPNLNSSGTMDVSYGGTTYTGMLLARNAPNGSWSANTTYNTSNITGPVMLATTGGEKIDLSGSFTVDSMRAKDGSNIESVNTTQYAYKTSNATELMEMQNRLTSLRQEIEERQPSGGGGIGGLGGSSSIVIVAAAAAVFVLFGRN
jgi:hypothetical protein